MERRGFLAGVAASAIAAPQIGWAKKPKHGGDDLAEMEADVAASSDAELLELGGKRLPGTVGAAAQSTTGVGDEYYHDIPALDEELRALLASETPYWRIPEAQRPVPRWPVRSRDPDTWLLSDSAVPADPGFSLDAALLRELFAANAFALRDAPVHLFGLRGATLVDGEGLDSGWAASHAVRAAIPDHVDRQCLIGVWRASDDALRLFSASTVPQVANVYRQLPSGGWGVSLLPCGLYNFVSGTHNKDSPGPPDLPRPQPGALLNRTGRYVVLRATTPTGDAPGVLSYDPFSPHNAWTVGAGHNLHSAGLGTTPLRFDSSGCQVIRGRYNTERTRGTDQWLAFQIAAGLADATGRPSADERPYDYALLPALEALLLDRGDPDFVRGYQRLRPGSRGPRVRAMREQLAREVPLVLGKPPPAPGDTFDWMTSFAVLQWYKADPDTRENAGIVWRG